MAGYGFNNQQQNPGFGQTPNQNFPNQSQMMAPSQQNIQPLFPQPQGNVYQINSTLEVANVPVGAGISVALCLPENVMFIKTMQNGNPLFYPYKILPFANETESPQAAQSEENITITDLAKQLKDCNEKISTIESQLKSKKKGAEFDV